MASIGTESMESLKQAALGASLAAVRRANNLPAPGDDYKFYCSYDGFRHFCQHQGSHIKKLVGGLLHQQDINTTWMAQGSASAEDCEDQMERLIEANDSILERVNIMLDEATGVRHAEPVQAPMSGQTSPAVASWNKDRASTSSATVKGAKLIHGKSTLRPQLAFKEPVDNSNAPFIPKLHRKPNAIVPLPAVSQTESTDGASFAVDMLLSSARKGESFQPVLHPYEPELLQWEPSEDVLQPVKEQLYSPLADTPLTYIDTVEDLEELCVKLARVSEIAIDLEAHSYRSFQGFTCLMQISTRSEDFLVDTLKLRSELVMLNDVFTDPNVVKVLHGADSDVVWLQRDHNLYLVNMFDTGQAARALELPRLGLAYLLQFYCDVTANKKFQLADWRIRPLGEELVKYAREDTHYLLYIYDRLRNELIEKSSQGANLLSTVWTQSRNLCLKYYEKPLFSNESYLYLCSKHKKKFNAPQMEALRLLYEWRDKTARREDESTGFVLPNEMMFQIAQNMPRELQGILACCNPVPTLIRQNVQEIYLMISQARLLPTNGPVPTLPPRFDRQAGDSWHATPARAKKSPTALSKLISKVASDQAVPVREFSHGFAITGPPVPITQAVLSILAFKPPMVSRASLLSPAEQAAVDKFSTPVQSTVTPVMTPNISTAASPAVDTSASPVLERAVPKVDMPMDEGKDDDVTGESDHPIWGAPKPRDEAASGSQTVSPIADKKGDPEEKPLRSLMASKTGLKRKREEDDEPPKASTGAPVTDFKPFDYEKAHQEAAKAASRKAKEAKDSAGAGSAGRAKKRAVNPMKDTSSFKTPRRSKVHNKAAERSKTFSDKKSGGGVQWPKR